MKILTVMSRKGGAGKTTVAINLALAFREAGLSALQLGDEAILHPDGFKLSGPDMKPVRQAVTRARPGRVVISTSGQIVDQPGSPLQAPADSPIMTLIDGVTGSGVPTAVVAPVAAHSVQHSDTPPPIHPASVWGRRRVLLLNSTYEPLTALPMRRAVIMLMCGKADVVHDDPSGPVIHSATRTIVVPSVIRLRTFVRVPYRARIPMTRAALMHRDRFRCAYCGQKADTVDHVIPRSRGGEHSWENCVAACSSCNHRKADHLLAELGWVLRAAPLPPKGQHWRLLSTVKELDPAWVRYLGEGAA